MGETLIREIEIFLKYLQENDFQPSKRQRLMLKYSSKKENLDRIIDLCLASNQIIEREEYEFSSKKGKGKKKSYHESTSKGPYPTYQITIEGLKFLEEQQKEKRVNEYQKIQSILTVALFTAAFFQGIVLTIYYFLDLIILNKESSAAYSFIGIILFLLIGIFIILNKLFKTID